MSNWGALAAAPAAPFSQPEEDAKLAAWLDARAGKLTASRMNDAMSFLKDGRPSVKRSDYMRELLSERLTGYSTRHYVNAAMEWGLQTEPEAKLAYQELTGKKLLPAEFIEHPTIANLGATPDGFVDSEGLLEVKAPTTTTFIEWKLKGGVPEEHVAQMTTQVLCTGRKWVDFFGYDPRIREVKKRYILHRFEPSQQQLDMIAEHAMRFLSELDELWERFITAA